MSPYLADLKTFMHTFGDHRRGAPPVPIPNTAVKPSAADGSWSLSPARVGYCQIMAPITDKVMGAFFLMGDVVSVRPRTLAVQNRKRY